MSEDEFASKAARLKAARKAVRTLRLRAVRIGLVIESLIARGVDPGKARESLGQTLISLAEASFRIKLLSQQLGHAA